MDWTEIAGHATGMAHLATASADGTPHVAALFAGVEGDTIWAFTRRSSKKARNIAENDRVSVMWMPRAELYVRGRAELIGDGEELRRAWDARVAGYDPSGFFGSPENPDLVLVKITPIAAVLYLGADAGVRRVVWSAPA